MYWIGNFSGGGWGKGEKCIEFIKLYSFYLFILCRFVFIRTLEFNQQKKKKIFLNFFSMLHNLINRRIRNEMNLVG
ncbi:hypothetical protein BLOT_012963 [Blomia tropicalis]|nr:hypothetical protein BLOT_012963 [Blomia tropicalis]